MDRRLGCVILHGLSSSLDTVKILGPVMERAGIPYRMPCLRGHGSTPEALLNVTYHDWYADAEAALRDLLTETEHAVIVGLSMGGLVALNLAMEYGKGYPDSPVVGVCTIAVALRLRNPLASFAKLLAPFMPWIQGQPSTAYQDQSLVRYDTNYTRLPVNSIMTFIDYQREIKRRLAEVVTPALIIGTHADRLVDASMSRLVYDCISTPPDQKKLLWFDSSGHEMLRDCEREKVAETTGQWVIAIRDRLPAESRQ